MKTANIVALAGIFLCMEAYSQGGITGRTVRINAGKKKTVVVVKDYNERKKTRTVSKKGKKKTVEKDMNTQPDPDDTWEEP